MKTSSVLVTSLAAVVLLTAAAPAARAFVSAENFWDPGHTGTAPGSGGSGIWDTTTANWSFGNGGGDGTFVNYPQRGVTYFEGAAGMVNLNASGIVNGDVVFFTTGYVVQDEPGTSYALTIDGGIYAGVTSGTVTLSVPASLTSILSNGDSLETEAGGTLAITGSLTSSNGLDAGGNGNSSAGTVILSGNNSITGITTLSGGTLELDGASTTVASGVRRLGGPTTSQVLGGTSGVTISGGTLLYGASDQLAAATPITLNGGAFSPDGFNQDRTNAFGPLKLSLSSAIDFGAGVRPGSTVAFADSSGIAWSGQLSIYDYRGTPLLGGGVDQLYFGATATGLTAAQLSDITFYVGGPGSAELGTGIILSDGEVSYTPEIVPEPSAWVMMFSGVGLVGLTCHRRRARCNQAFAQGRAASTRDHFRAGDNRAVSEYNATTGVAISIVVRHEAKNHFGGKYVVPGSFPTLPHTEGIFPPGH
jgi:autotransporter-associated beta strand protein